MTACPLTNNELEYAKFAADGKTADEVSEINGRTPFAMRSALEKARGKAGASNTTGLVAMALRKGWIE